MKALLRKTMKRTIAFWMVIVCLFSSTALAATYRTLEFGSKGSEVLALQKALLSLGFNPSGTDGKFGRGTENAVKAYQASKGLETDGKAGSQTQTAIYSDLQLLNTASAPNGSTSAGSATSSLRYGDSGTRVTDLQTALNKLGYNTNGVDGRFGAGTERAVIAFQKANKLKADGIAGTKTLEILYVQANNAGNSSAGSNTGSGSTGTPSRTLRKGYTGEDVKQVQRRLQELKYYAGTIDGVYGTGSMAAAKAFQARNGLNADGIAGPQTFARLFSANAVAADGNSGSAGNGSTGNSSTGNGSSTTYVTLRPGDTGEAVRTLQRALAALNYNVNADGTYGDMTKAAVVAFQQRNGLTADGVAGALTQSRLYSGSANGANTSGGSSSGGSSTGSSETGKVSGPSTSSVRLLHWFNEVKPSIKTGQNITVFDPATSYQWTLRLYSLGRHADSEPKSQADTDTMFKAFGSTNTWTPKPVYVQLPNGVWTLASMHNVPHLSGSIQNNGFDGHLCVHFLRDMDECKANDPDYGVTNQNAIRKKWKEMTGETIN